jgi:1-aminocyclopropane-1-carboxylate deaminase
MIELNSPVQPLLFKLFEEKKIQVFIKRDDLIHPFVSGNKWRKLKYTLLDAKAKGKTHLVSFGGAYSNHLNALACASAMYGFKASAFVRGEAVNNHMLALNKLWGMELHFVDRTSYKDKTALYKRQYGNNTNTYFIDEGGAGVLGAKGCEEIVSELDAHYDDIFCAVGTATTLQGITQAIKEKNLPTKAHGICVLKGALSIDEHLKAAQLDSYYTMHHTFHEGGYAKSNEALIAFIQMFASETGILLDPIYTAKMMKAVFTLAEQDYFKTHARVLCVHTGGLLGLLEKL